MIDVCPQCKRGGRDTYKGRKLCKSCFRENVKANTQKNIDFIATYKENKCCFDCDNNYHPAVMEFDHRDGDKKSHNISDMVHKGWGLKSILIEIDKCDLVCANCHRMRTVERKKDPIEGPFLLE